MQSTREEVIELLIDRVFCKLIVNIMYTQWDVEIYIVTNDNSI
jgi:hypothetical protein